MSFDFDRLSLNLTAVRTQMDRAAERANRHPHAVRLVAVTKYASVEIVQGLYRLGCRDFGESRTTGLLEKQAALPRTDYPDIHWHFIGHLQRNKVAKTLADVDLLHSLDSLRLMHEVDRIAATRPESVRALLEVNISGESVKHGFSRDQVAQVVAQLAAFPHIQVCGLMAMAGADTDLAETSRQFSAVRALREQIQERVPELELPHLSMGMSGDFPAAIAQGATIVRVGSALFEGV